MRIIGNIPHPLLKITVFQLNLKYAVKVESGMMEQTYKLRESDRITGLESIAGLIDDRFAEECLRRFEDMNMSLGQALKRSLD